MSGAHRDPEEGQGLRKPRPHTPTSWRPQPLPPGLKRGAWVSLLPPKICCPPRFPEGPRRQGYQFCERIGVSPPASRSTGAPSTAAFAHPVPNSGAEPTSWTPGLGGRFRRAPQGGGRATPASPFRPLLCPPTRVCSPRLPPTGSGVFSVQTRPARS